MLAGTAAPTSGRISFGGKSPLTGGIKETNSGGNPGQHLMKLGYRAVIVTGKPADPEKRYGLEITAKGAEIVDADDYQGPVELPALREAREDRYAKTASFISIGPAGELQLTGASIATTDQDHRYPNRHAGRGGMGAVMGSKGLKYVAVNPGKTRMRQAADARGFTAYSKKIAQAYLDGPKMFQGRDQLVRRHRQLAELLPAQEPHRGPVARRRRAWRASASSRASRSAAAACTTA